MQDYDVTLKLLLRSSARVLMRELAGVAIERWLDVELPRVQNPRVDLVGETADGSVFRFELQSSNDADMPLRMAEYQLPIYRLLRRFPRQLLLYVGEAPVRMETELRGPDSSFRYYIVDVRDLDGERLLDSPDIGDNVVAILAKLQNHREGVRRIVERIDGLAPTERETALNQLLILAGLRRLEEVVERETRKMPLEINILENRVLGREYKRGLQEGELKGKLEGKLETLRRLIQKRFGAIPGSVDDFLTSRTTDQLTELSDRIFDAESLEDLLR